MDLMCSTIDLKLETLILNPYLKTQIGYIQQGWNRPAITTNGKRLRQNWHTIGCVFMEAISFDYIKILA